MFWLFNMYFDFRASPKSFCGVAERVVINLIIVSI